MRVDEDEDSDVRGLVERRAHLRKTVRAIVQGEEAESFASSLSPNPLVESDIVTDLASEDVPADLGKRGDRSEPASDQARPRRTCSSSSIQDAEKLT